MALDIIDVFALIHFVYHKVYERILMYMSLISVSGFEFSFN